MKRNSCIFDRKVVVIQQENLKALGNESEVIFKEKEEINSPILESFNTLLMFGALYEALYMLLALMIFYKKEYD